MQPDKMILLYLIFALVSLTCIQQAIKNFNPEIAKTWNVEFFTFPLAMMAFFVLMRWLGYEEGFKIGFKEGLHDVEKPFMFLPYGGLTEWEKIENNYA